MDIGTIADPGDKIRECEFFLGLASTEPDRTRFRWLISAYLNAVYSYFEITALSAFTAFTDPKTGAPAENTEALENLSAYVCISQGKKNPYYVKTSDPKHQVIARIYELRKTTTHRFPSLIRAAGANLPADFYFFSFEGKDEPVLALCHDALTIIKQVQAELDASTSS
ncbi:MAG: hypothetical protein JSR32_03180 [Proteobacteria bacterium]|nr:hypothetical protein [Pseudomonadota bacterium]